MDTFFKIYSLSITLYLIGIRGKIYKIRTDDPGKTEQAYFLFRKDEFAGRGLFWRSGQHIFALYGKKACKKERNCNYLCF